MQPFAVPDTSRRYQIVASKKAEGVTYTPTSLARFVAEQIVENTDLTGCASLSILDPAIGDGELVLALLHALRERTDAATNVRGFDTNISALDVAARRINSAYHKTRLDLTHESFLDLRCAMATPMNRPCSNPPSPSRLI